VARGRLHPLYIVSRRDDLHGDFHFVPWGMLGKPGARRKGCGKRPGSTWRENAGFSKILLDFVLTKVIVSPGFVRRFPLETRKYPSESLEVSRSRSGLAHPIHVFSLV
jgi:hypothetical protein